MRPSRGLRIGTTAAPVWPPPAAGFLLPPPAARVLLPLPVARVLGPLQLARVLEPLWGLLLALALAAFGGCGTAPPRTHFDSHLSFDRSFDIALAAMADQRMTFSAQDRRQGRIVGTIDGSTLVATIQPSLDGMFRVVFEPQGDSPADAALLGRVGAAYNERMAKLGLLGGFKDEAGAATSKAGPRPCPSGPALCP
jgi:hypothetical protein